MVVFPFCKINLGLNIISKRADGFHNIETCFFPIYSLSDILEIVPNDSFSFVQTGINIENANIENNLVVKAFRLFQEKYCCSNVSICLHKCIPAGAGLGGGSADAAFTLLLLNQLFKINAPIELLSQLAIKMGSDCAFFLQNKSCIGEDLGEKLHSVSIPCLSNHYILLVKPNIFISTAEAYRLCSSQNPTFKIEEILTYPLEKWKDFLFNDFEKVLFSIYPELQAIKTKLYENGAIYASLSGTGATIFGIFKQKPQNIFLDKNYFIHIHKIE